MTPEGNTRRIRLNVDMSRFPARSAANPAGLPTSAAAAGPPSPVKSATSVSGVGCDRAAGSHLPHAILLGICNVQVAGRIQRDLLWMHERRLLRKIAITDPDAGEGADHVHRGRRLRRAYG